MKIFQKSDVAFFFSKRKFTKILATACLAILGFAYSVSARNLPEGFVYVDELMPEVLVEPRYFTNDNFVGCPVDGYRSNRFILTRKAVQALKKVQADLKPFGLSIKILDAYRPRRAVNHFVRWAKDLSDTRMKAMYYPGVDKKDLFKKGYIAEKSSHSRGSTVDLTLVNMVPGQPSEELDMGTGFDFFSPLSWPGSFSVNASARAHRMLLQQVMVAHGFAPYFAEWWHFTLKEEPFPETYFDFPIE